MKKIISIVLFFCYMLQLTCCHTPMLASKDELLSSKDKPGIIIKTNEQFEYFFDKDSYTINNDSINGVGNLILENSAEVKDNTYRQISLDDVEEVRIEKLDAAKTIFTGAIVVGLFVLLLVGIKSVMQDITQGVAEGIGRGLQGTF